MKSNLVVIGDNEKINKSIGEKLAVILELNYLDFDGYCEYVNMIDCTKVIEQFGKRKYNDIQKDTLPHMQDFCDSVICFDGKLSRFSAVYKLLKDTSYLVCVADSKNKEKYSKYADIWISSGVKSNNKIIKEIIRKLGEIQ